MTALEDDPRWRQLQDYETKCRSCGESHRGLFDLAYFCPDYWSGAEEYEPNRAVRESTNFLSEDFCVLDGEQYFARCVLPLPLVGSDEHFGFGVWSSLSKASFDAYLEHFEDGGYPPGTQWFGWFSNRLKGYPDTLNLKCQVIPQSGRQRPLIELEATDHPLALDQHNGITLDRLLEVFAANGHELDVG